MDDDWDSAENPHLVISNQQPGNINKWAGEDESEDVKDSWEDEEEKKDEEKVEATIAAAPSGKLKHNRALQAKLASQEEKEVDSLANMTPEELLANKLRLQKIQEESDLNSALETLGVSTNGLDTFNPKTKEDFKEFATALSWKLSQYKDSIHFPQFTEDLVRSICLNLSVRDLKKIKSNIDSLHSEKKKMVKTAPKTKSKATIRIEADYLEDYKKYGDDYDDYDDFM